MFTEAKNTSGRPRLIRGWPLARVLLGLCVAGFATAAPYIPAKDAAVLADLPLGARHRAAADGNGAAARIDVALPLAQFYVARARATGDLRFLGYAEAALLPWLQRPPVPAAVLVMDATVQQSLHAFDASLDELDRALRVQPDLPQAWLTRATVLRVLGRYPEALDSCAHLAAADPAVMVLCTESIRALTGHLRAAYDSVAAIPAQALPPEVSAWRCSELGEMAERLGDDAAAERFLRSGLVLAPQDLYLRNAYADLLLRQGRAAETLELLAGFDSMEPMLLRSTLAHQLLHDGASDRARALLANAFALEQQRGDVVHRREQARFLLDVAGDAPAAVEVAAVNWQVQREPDDLLILLRAARAAGLPDAAEPARQFLREQHLEDRRFGALLGAAP